MTILAEGEQEKTVRAFLRKSEPWSWGLSVISCLIEVERSQAAEILETCLEIDGFKPASNASVTEDRSEDA